MVIHWKKHSKLILLVVLATIVLFTLFVNSNYSSSSTSSSSSSSADDGSAAAAAHHSRMHISAELYGIEKEWFLVNCLKQPNINQMSLEFLPDYVEQFQTAKSAICNQVAHLFRTIFELDESFGEIVIGEHFEKKVRKWLNDDPSLMKQAVKQKIIKLYNKYLYEEVIYNPLRGKRPQSKLKTSDRNYSMDLLKSSMNDCDFCEGTYRTNTATDIFDRIETKLSYTAANTFKYDKWHSIIVSRNHNTLYLTRDEIVDMFYISLTWFKKVNQLDATAIYPELIWDAMPKSGASQVHTHLQTSMGINSYYGAMRRLLEASNLYRKLNERNYFDDFILVHKALGLTKQINNTFIIINLIPLKEQEVMIIGQNDEETYNTIASLYHDVIRVFVDHLEQYSFSMGMYLPEFSKPRDGRGSSSPFNQNNNNGNKNNHKRRSSINDNNNKRKLNLIYSRILFRNPVANLRSDFNGLDLYTSSVLSADRYTIANKLFAELDKLYK